MQPGTPNFYILLLLCATLPAVATSPARSLVNWSTSNITIEVDAAIPDGVATRPAARHRARTDAQDNLPGLLAKSILSLRIDSTHTVRTLPEQNRLLGDLERVYRSRDPKYSRVSEDFSHLQLRWQFPLYPAVAELLVAHKQARPVPRRLGWTPRAEYTGILIYARHIELKGALFPRILDSRGRVIFDKNMQPPEGILHNGMVAYMSKTDEAKIAGYVGSTPRRLTALEADGCADIVLNDADVHALLSTPSTREAMRDGRIVILIAETEEPIRY